MRLRKLTAIGFKSFADKTVIDFHKPVTGIVGPNGCGKSNTVDAAKWVLGSLSPKSLRGDQMMDMIFNGSSTRKPAGMAQVTLSFSNPVQENGKRKLPLDYDEVSVTRRLYRDGSSEYMINNQRARLRDIREMFMDTGVGTDAYSIIEQGKVARLLDSNTKDRREIFEEAAGISRFKSRKKEAERKLDRTEQQLEVSRTRLNDLQRRLRSVKIQAGRARSYKELSHRLGELQLNYALAEYHKLHEGLNALADQLDQSEADLTAANRQLHEHEQNLSDTQLEKQAIEQQQKKLEHDRVTARSSKENAEQRKQFTQNTLDDVQHQIERDGKRLEELTLRISELETELVHHRQEVETLSQERLKAEEGLESAEHEYRQMQHTLNESRSSLEDEKAGIVSLMRRTAQLQNEISSIDVFESNLHGAREKLGKRKTEISGQLEGLLTSRDETQAGHDQAKQLIEQQDVKLDDLQNQASALGKEHEVLAGNLAEAKDKRTSLESRRAVLQEMQDNQEGVTDAVKAVLARKAASDAAADSHGMASEVGEAADGSFAFVRGLLADMFETDIEFAPAVEAALGDHQQSLVIDRLSDICEKSHGDPSRREGASDLLDSLAGRVSFLAIDQCRIPGSAELGKLPGSIAMLPRVIDLIRFPQEIGPLAWSLLGRTLIAPNLATAKQYRHQLPSGYRFVTAAGELLEADGRVTAGPIGIATAGGLISRRSELATLNHQIASLDTRINTERTELAELSDRSSHIESIAQELRKTNQEANTMRIELGSRLESLNGQIGSLEREQPVVAAETEQIHRQLRDANEKKQSHQDEAAQLEQDSTARQDAVDNLSAQILELNAAAEHKREAVTAIRVELSKLSEQLTAAERQVRQIGIARADVQRQHKVVDDQLQQHVGRVDELENTVEEAQQQMLQADSTLDQIDAALVDVNEKHGSVSESLDAIADLLQAQRQVASKAENLIHELHVSKRELEVKSEGVVQRADEQLNLDVVSAYADLMQRQQAAVGQDADSDTEVDSNGDAAGAVEADGDSDSDDDALVNIDWEAVETEILELRKKLERLGNVNLDAIGEQDEVEKQHEELEVQVVDIEDGKRKLEQLIKQINEDSRSRFEKTFEEIRENFAGQQGLFRKLFGGGKADVVMLPDEEGNIDVLESGIEIIAKPPGKEPQSISLLSGGEKTMTAVALLLSIFKTKPSPFAILDEVDAALDDSNVERFASIIHSFLDHSNFIVITHNKATMQSCDVLYGITMQERGVSKRVSVQFDQIGSSGEISADAIKAQDKVDRDKASQVVGDTPDLQPSGNESKAKSESIPESVPDQSPAPDVIAEPVVLTKTPDDVVARGSEMLDSDSDGDSDISGDAPRSRMAQMLDDADAERAKPSAGRKVKAKEEVEAKNN